MVLAWHKLPDKVGKYGEAGEQEVKKRWVWRVWVMEYSDLIFGRMVSIHQRFCCENNRGISGIHCQVGDALRYIYTAKHLLGLDRGCRVAVMTCPPS